MMVILRVSTDYFVTPGDVRDAVQTKLGADVELEGRSDLELQHSREIIEAGAELDRWSVPREGRSLVDRIHLLGQNWNEAALHREREIESDSDTGRRVTE